MVTQITNEQRKRITAILTEYYRFSESECAQLFTAVIRALPTDNKRPKNLWEALKNFANKNAPEGSLRRRLAEAFERGGNLKEAHPSH